MSLWSEMEKDGPEFLKTFGRPIVFRGINMSALVSRAPVDQMLVDGGFQYNSYYTVRILIPMGSELEMNPPKDGEFVTVFGRKYTITGITHRPPSPWIDLSVGLSSSV